jgi:hypothetical protein
VPAVSGGNTVDAERYEDAQLTATEIVLVAGAVALIVILLLLVLAAL